MVPKKSNKKDCVEPIQEMVEGDKWSSRLCS